MHLVVLATLFLGDLVAGKDMLVVRWAYGRRVNFSHVVGQLLQVSLLLVELLLEFEEPLLLALANGVVLVGALAALEGVTVSEAWLACRPIVSLVSLLSHSSTRRLRSPLAPGGGKYDSPLTSGLGRSTRLAGHCSCGGGEGGSGEGARAGKLGEGGAKHFCWRSFDCED